MSFGFGFVVFWDGYLRGLIEVEKAEIGDGGSDGEFGEVLQRVGMGCLELKNPEGLVKEPLGRIERGGDGVVPFGLDLWCFGCCGCRGCRGRGRRKFGGGWSWGCRCLRRSGRGFGFWF